MPEAQQKISSGVKTVAIIEDDQNLLTLLKFKLEKEGHRVVASDNGRDALELLIREKPDLLLLDIDLPYKNGLEILKDIRNNDALRPLAVIIISNSGNPVDIHQVKKLGVKDYMIKVDFDPDTLMAIVRKYLV